MRFDFECLYRVQQSIRHLHGPVLDTLTRFFTRSRVSLWAFGKYLNICHPALVSPARRHDDAEATQAVVAAA